MPATYEPIATTTLGSAASSITFSSIPGTYTDLRLVMTYTATNGANGWFRFNSDTGGNYSLTMLHGSGSSANSYRMTNETRLDVVQSLGTGNSTAIALINLDIFSYAGSTNKTILSEVNADNNGAGNITRSVGLWRNTSAINTITILLSSGNYSTGTTATLYGILKA